jgi:long-chain acyl-CoA synthetase
LAHGIPDRSTFPSLEYIICGAAPLSANLQKEFMEKARLPVPNGWGMTETGCWGCHSDPNDIVPGSMGRPLPINEMKIVDPQTGRDLPAGRVGTLVIRGKNVFREYFDAPEATTQAFRFGNGWFDTGDDARLDERGNFFFIGRGSVDTGKVDGEFVNFLAIDEKLWTHPKVQEVCCVGVPDIIRGAVVAACIVPKPGISFDSTEIMEYAKKQGLARWEIPAYVLVVPEIPKGDTGKIQRKVMTERAVAMLSREVIDDRR